MIEAVDEKRFLKPIQAVLLTYKSRTEYERVTYFSKRDRTRSSQPHTFLKTGYPGTKHDDQRPNSMKMPVLADADKPNRFLDFFLEPERARARRIVASTKRGVDEAWCRRSARRRRRARRHKQPDERLVIRHELSARTRWAYNP